MNSTSGLGTDSLSEVTIFKLSCITFYRASFSNFVDTVFKITAFLHDSAPIYFSAGKLYEKQSLKPTPLLAFTRRFFLIFAKLFSDCLPMQLRFEFVYVLVPPLCNTLFE